MLKRQCAWCGKELGMKDGHGISDTTHGICKCCFVVELTKIRMAIFFRRLLSWLPTAVMIAMAIGAGYMVIDTLDHEAQIAKQQAFARVQYAVLVKGDN